MADNSPTEEGAVGAGAHASVISDDLIFTDISDKSESNDARKFLEGAAILAALPTECNTENIKKKIASGKNSQFPPKQNKEISRPVNENRSTEEAISHKEKCIDKSDVKNSLANSDQPVALGKLVFGAASSAAGVIQVDPKFKQDTIIDIEDHNSSPNANDDLQSEKRSKQVENPNSPQQASQSNENGLEKLKDLLGKELPKDVDAALKTVMLTGMVAVATSANPEVTQDRSNESNIHDHESQEQENSSGTPSTDKNKVVPFDDRSPQSDATGSEEGSQSDKRVAGSRERRGSSTWRAIAWAVGTMMTNPAIKIKVAPKDQHDAHQDGDVEQHDTASSDSEKNGIMDQEVGDEIGTNDKTTQTEEPMDEVNEVITDEPRPGPSRLATMDVGGPEVISPTDFINQDDQNETEEKVISAESADAMNENNDVKPTTECIVFISRATQTTEIDPDEVSLELSTTEIEEINELQGTSRSGCFNGIWLCNGTKLQSDFLPDGMDCPSKEEVHESRPFPMPNDISKETTTTWTQTEQSKDMEVDDTEVMIINPMEGKNGFIGRIWGFIKRRRTNVALADEENQMQEIVNTSGGESVMLQGNVDHGTMAETQPDINGRNTDSAINIEMDVLPNNPGDDKKNATTKEGTTVSPEDERTSEEDPTVETKQPRQDVNNTIASTTSNRATQTDTGEQASLSMSEEKIVETPTGGRFNWIKAYFCGEEDVNKQLEEAIKYDAKLGFSTFTVNDDGELETTPRRKVTFIVIMLLAAFNTWKEIRKLFYYMAKEPKSDHTYFYLQIASQIAILMLLVGHFALIWWGEKTVGKAVNRLRRTRSPAKNKSRFSARKLRAASLYTGVILILSGSTVLQQAEEYSVERIWSDHELDLYRSLVPDAFDKAVADDIARNSNNITITHPPFTNSTLLNPTGMDVANPTTNNTQSTEAPPSQRGFFLKDGIWETYIFGTLSLALALIGQITFSSAPDWLLVNAFIIWRFVDSALDVENLILEDEDGNPLTPEERQRRMKIARESLEDHDIVLTVSSDINETGKIIWPALLLTAIFMLSQVVHLWYQGMWFKSIAYLSPLSKVFTILFIGLKISQKIDLYYDWLMSTSARELLDMDLFEFERRKGEIKRKPIGFGMGPTLTSLKFIYSLFGVVSSNIVLLVQAFFSASQ